MATTTADHTTTPASDTGDPDAADTAPADGRHLVDLHLDPFEVEALGLQLTSDGIHLDVETVPADEPRLASLLAGALRLLRRLRAAARAAVDSPIERLRSWLISKLLHLVRVAAGRLIKIVAARIGEKASAKSGGSSGGGTAKRSGSKSGGSRSAKASGEKSGSKGERKGKNASAKTPSVPARVPSPDEAKEVVRNMPSRKAKHLAKGVSKEELDELTAAQPPAERERVRASVVRLQEAAAEAASGG